MKLSILSVLGLLLAFSLIFTGCSSSISDSQNTSSTLSSGNGLTGAAIGVPEDPVEEVKPVEKPLAYNIRVQELKLMASQADSYKYTFKSISMENNGISVEETSFKLFVRGDQMKKVYLQAKHHQKGLYYNEVYLNPLTHTAYGTCTLRGVICSDSQNKYFKLNYFAEAVVDTPVELMAKLDGNTKALRETMSGDRHATVLQSELPDGTMERLVVDDFYGLPLDQIIFKYNSDEEEVVLHELRYISLVAGTGTVKLDDVTIPANFVEVE
ncbi:MAG: hypothetical protein WCV90_03640 [Candidatus Woesearchaeota archaeon]